MVKSVAPKKGPTEAQKLQAEIERVEKLKDNFDTEYKEKKELDDKKWFFEKPWDRDRFLSKAKDQLDQVEEALRNAKNKELTDLEIKKGHLRSARRFLAQATVYLGRSRTVFDPFQKEKFEKKYGLSLEKTTPTTPEQPTPEKIKIGPKIVDVTVEKNIDTGSLMDALISDGLDPILYSIKHEEDFYVILRETPEQIFKVRGGKSVLKHRKYTTFEKFFRAEDISDPDPEKAKEAKNAARADRLKYLKSEYRDKVWIQLLAETS